MDFPPKDDRMIAEGARASVEYAVRTNGTMEAKEWLESQPDVIQASFGQLFVRLATDGRIHNDRQFRRLQDEVWEFKRSIHRMLCFQVGSRYLLTHRIKKAGGIGKCPKSEIDHADLIGMEHIAFEARATKGRRK